jgi:sulfate transport system substrate-binding protein
VLLLALLAACGSDPAAPDAAPVRKLTLAAYTTPREAYGREVLPAFARAWKAKTGETVVFEESYQASGAQARAVVAGFEADVVALSLEPDVVTVQQAGLITHDWRATPTQGLVTTSLAVIAVRPGNPKGIQDWPDLTRADVEVLTPNVRTSGGAMWNVLGVWGAAMRGHAGVTAGDGSGAEALLTGILRRVSVMDKGARESIVTFEKGVGDAAITYENEVLGARRAGRAMDYVVPPGTVRIDNPIAVVDVYADKHGVRDVAEAFVAFVTTPEAQRAFADYGLRPVDPSVLPPGLPTPTDTFTVTDLGGWDAVRASVFADGAAYDRALALARPEVP